MTTATNQTAKQQAVETGMTVVTLNNGLKVANFSSPHEFRFETGETLYACSAERARRLMLHADEVVTDRGNWKDIELSFTLGLDVTKDLLAAQEFAADHNIDVILVPLPVMGAMKNAGWYIPDTPFRCIRKSDRVTNLIYSDRFCM